MSKCKTAVTRADRLVLAVALPFVLLACLGLYYLLFQIVPGSVLESENGVWDLRGHDLSSQNIQLAGEVECIPGALLTPEEYTARQGEAVLLHDAFPQQVGTSRQQLKMPDDGWYTFTRTSVDYSTRLFVNGVLLTEVGSPSDTVQNNVSNLGRITFTAKAENGVIELVQQSSNYVHRDGGYHGGWQVGGAALWRAAEAFDFAVLLEMGAYLALLFLHLLLFLLLPNYKANLYFAACCFTWFLRMGTTGNHPFSILAPILPWELKFRVEYGTVAAVILLTTLIIREVFPGVMQKGVMWFVYASNGLFFLLCLVLSTTMLSYVAPFFLVIAMLLLCYIIVRFCLKLRRPRVEQLLLLAGIALVGGAAARDILCYVRYSLQPGFVYVETMQIAVLAFTLLAAVAFSIDTMRRVKQARDAEQRLAMENAALDEVNRLKSDLMGTLSHELRTPLAVMSGYAQLAERQIADGSADSTTRQDLRTVSREAQRLAELADGLLQGTMAPQSTPQQRESLSAEQVVARAAAVARPILAKRKNTLSSQIPQDLPPVLVNGDGIHQVLLNLLTNANRHMEHGTITITAGAAAPKEPGFVAVEVCDTGPGVAPELLPHVFESQVTDGGGAGMGLAICRSIIQAHGGHIELENLPGKGTRVRFTLPVAE